MLPVKIKICGMREPANILKAAALEPDYMGFVFYRPSPRYAGATAGEEERLIKLQATLAGLQKIRKIKKTAVFVNEPLESALKIAGRLGMDAVQLHGNESPEYCRAMKEQGFELIKAFGVGEDFDFALTRPYEEMCDHFLFDSRTRIHGGSGKVFGWEQLERYSGARTFFLSGGLDLGNLPQALELSARLPVAALDLNSCFESAPGLKDIEKLKKAIRLIRSFTSK